MQNDTNVFEQSRDLTFNLPHSLNRLFGRHSEIRITLSHRQTLQLPFQGTGRDRFSIRVTRGNDTLYEAEQVFNYFDTTRVIIGEVETPSTPSSGFSVHPPNPFPVPHTARESPTTIPGTPDQALPPYPHLEQAPALQPEHIAEHRDAVQLLLAHPSAQNTFALQPIALRDAIEARPETPYFPAVETLEEPVVRHPSRETEDVATRQRTFDVLTHELVGDIDRTLTEILRRQNLESEETF